MSKFLDLYEAAKSKIDKTYMSDEDTNKGLINRGPGKMPALGHKSHWQSLSYQSKHKIMKDELENAHEFLSSDEKKLASSNKHYDEGFQDGFDAVMSSGKPSELPADAYKSLGGEPKEAAILGWKIGQQAAETYKMERETR